MKITTIFVIGFSLMITVVSTNVGGQQDSGAPRQLIVGTKEAPPFSMKTSDGQWTGLSIDLWQQKRFPRRRGRRLDDYTGT